MAPGASETLRSCPALTEALVGRFTDHHASLARLLLTLVVNVPGAGHSIALEQPQQVNAAIEEHLAAASDGPG